MTKLTKFESDLIRLEWVWNRLGSIYLEFPKIQRNSAGSRYFSFVVRDMIILHLHSFLKIRADLIDEPIFKKLDNCLQLLLKDILHVKKPIKKIRNNYIAHIQDTRDKKPFNTMIQEIVDEYNLPTALVYWIDLAGRVHHYGGFVNANFTNELDVANRKYNAMSPELLTWGRTDVQSYEKRMSTIIKRTVKNLYSKNYKTGASNNLVRSSFVQEDRDVSKPNAPS